MFRNLKDKLATQVNKTNQTLFSTILPTDPVCSEKRWHQLDYLVSLFSRTARHHSEIQPLATMNTTYTERRSLSLHSCFLCSSKGSARSRIDSASSDISQTQASYLPSTRQFVPPSDIESEYGGDESDHETNSVKCIFRPTFSFRIYPSLTEGAETTQCVQKQIHATEECLRGGRAREGEPESNMIKIVH